MCDESGEKMSTKELFSGDNMPRSARYVLRRESFLARNMGASPVGFHNNARLSTVSFYNDASNEHSSMQIQTATSGSGQWLGGQK